MTGLKKLIYRERLDRAIALIAQDKKKDDLVELALEYRDTLAKHELYATGTTGGRIADATGLDVHRFKSGPLGGDQQIGTYISEDKIDLVLFICDLLTAHPHEPDVSAGTKLEYVPTGIFQLEQLSSTYYLTQKDLL